jgi:DNA polymerase-3 subunit beta
MKITCTLENFKKAVYSTERVIGRQITLPILENILLEAEKGMLRMSATNLEIGVFIKIGAKIEGEGSLTVPAKLLGNFVNNLPADGNILLEVKEQSLKIESGSYSAKIKGMGAQDFPIIPETAGDFLFSIPAEAFKEIIPKLLTSVSIDSTRPELSGVNLIFKEGEIHLASTDSFRLTEGIVPIKLENQASYASFVAKNSSVIIPANTLSEVFRTVDQGLDEVKVVVEESQIFFQIGNVRIVSRLINGKYPEYKQIMPENFTTKVFMNKEELIRAVKIASFFTESKAGEVTFVLKPGEQKAEIKAQSVEKGENNASFMLAGSGPDQEIVFNPRYILDGINTISSPEVALLANSGTTPVALRAVVPENKEMKISEKYTYIIMPINK